MSDREIEARIFFSVMFDNVALAMAYLVPFDYLLMITMGSFIKLGSLPLYIQWIKYLSWLLHSTESLSIVQWHDVKNISCNAAIKGFPCIKGGDEVLIQYDFTAENFNLNICSMIVLYMLFYLLGYILLLRKCNQINYF